MSVVAKRKSENDERENSAKFLLTFHAYFSRNFFSLQNKIFPDFPENLHDRRKGPITHELGALFFLNKSALKVQNLDNEKHLFSLKK